MGYIDLPIEKIALPNDTDILPDTEWRYELVPGMGVYMRNITTENMPEEMGRLKDKTTGMLYGLFIDGNKEVVDNVFWLFAKKYAKGGRFSLALFLNKQIEKKEPFPDAFLTEKDNVIMYWVHNRERFMLLRELFANVWRTYINEAMPELSSEVEEKISKTPNSVATGELWNFRVRNNLKESVDINKVKKSSLRQFVHNGVYYKSMSDLYNKAAKKEIPKEFEKAITEALTLYAQSYTKHDDLKMIVDTETGTLLFKLNNGNTLYSYAVPLITLAQTWKSELKGGYDKDIKDWLDKTIEKLKDKTDIFKNFLNLNLWANYNNSVDLGVLFSVKTADKLQYRKYVDERGFVNMVYIDSENFRFIQLMLSPKDSSVIYRYEREMESKAKLDTYVADAAITSFRNQKLEEQGDCTIDNLRNVLSAQKPKEESEEEKLYRQFEDRYEDEKAEKLSGIYYNKVHGAVVNAVYNAIIAGVKAFDKTLNSEGKKKTYTLDVSVNFSKYGTYVSCDELKFEHFESCLPAMAEACAILNILDNKHNSYLVASQEISHWFEDAMPGVYAAALVKKLSLNFDIAEF